MSLTLPSSRTEGRTSAFGTAEPNSRPNHPTTCGKIERFQQTLKAWLRAQLDQPATIGQLQALLDVFVDLYNNRRPHRSLPQRCTPTVAYHARPKAAPGNRANDTHFRVRHDRVSHGGNVTLRHDGHLHHINIGRAHTGTRIILLIADLDVRIIHATTGEVLRHLTLNPDRHYHGTGRPPGPPPRKPQRPDP
jgi:Integrase core domain